MKIQDFFKQWTSTRPNLKASFHDAGIEAMAFAEAYHNQQLTDMLGDFEPKSDIFENELANEQTHTDHSDSTEQKALHIADVSGSALLLCEKCGGFTFTEDGKQCTNCGHYR